MTNYKQAHLDALQEAIATGAMEIEIDGPNGRTKVRYRSFAQMEQTEAKLIRELSGSSGSGSFGAGTLNFDRGTGR